MEITSLLSIVPIILAVSLIIGIAYNLKKGQTNITTMTGVIGGLILIVMLAIPIIGNVTTDQPSMSNWYYDDYNQIEGVTSTTGSLELVTINDIEYVHAKSIGAGTYTIDDETHNINVHKANLDVYMIAGQSNAAYRPYGCSDTATSNPNPIIGTAYYFGDENGPVSKPYTDTPVEDYEFMTAYSDDGTLRLAHLEGPFSYTHYEKTGHKTYTINCAIGGVSVNTYLPGKSTYVWAQSVFTAAMNKIDYDLFNVEVKDCLWIQGEADYAQSVDWYKSRFLMWHDSILGQSAINFNEDYQFKSILISQVRVTDFEGTPSGTNAINPAIAQNELSEEYSTISVVTNIADTFTLQNRYLIYDNLHYSQLGQNLIGIKFGDYSK